MRAFIEPLDGKYYGTKVWTEAGDVEIWCPNPRRPSDRQLQEWYPMDEPLSEYMCDNHYETAISYEMAQAFVRAVADIDYPRPE